MRGIDSKQVDFSIETGRIRFGEADKDEEFILCAVVNQRVEKRRTKI